MDHPKSPTHLADEESNSPTWIFCKVNVSTGGVANLKKYTHMCFLVKKDDIPPTSSNTIPGRSSFVGSFTQFLKLCPDKNPRRMV